MEKKEILLPRLRKFLVEEDERIRRGELKRSDIEKRDLTMIIQAAKKKFAEFNHGELSDADYFHPSALGACLRQVWFGYYNAPKDGTNLGASLLVSYLVFKTGDALHTSFQNLCARAGLLERREVPIISKQLKIMGHADGILEINGERHILEIKCVVPGTMLETAKGVPIRADKLKAGSEIIGFSGKLDKPVIVRVEDVWDNGKQPVVIVRTREGKTTVVTRNHPFLTKRGWINAENLRVGDKVRVASSSPWARNSKKYDLELAYFLGAMTGDGGCTGVSPYITSMDSDLIARLKKFGKNHGADLVPTGDSFGHRFRAKGGNGRTTGNPINSILRFHDLWGKGSHSKRVPEWIWRSGPKVWISFLSGYFDTDGHVVTSDKGDYPYVSWGSVNKKLLLDCQLLLARLGVRSSVAIHKGVYKGEYHESWNLMVRDREAVSAIKKVLKLTIKYKRDNLASLNPLKFSKTRRSYRRAEKGWDSVSEVEHFGEEKTIGIQVEGGVHFTDGIVTHNSINTRGYNTVRAPKPEHVWQSTAYMKSLGINSTIFVYLEKDRHNSKEFFVEYDEEIYRTKVRGRIDTFFKHVREATPPAREGHHPKQFPCSFCAFRKVCFDSGNLTNFEVALKKKLQKKS